ncbi:hypothetical protein K0O13_08035 [Mammaliicoccus sciuri]|uniref:hypothetical protein n=1 Tax=Mammaliicoccus sciuri TaxID=1296 RepID=UPI001C62BE0D|nr:hypothetical protein [Mammaliicoccus sciuri]QYG30049.1 hypothetical protein K0O13_08035 [Mammaliicoccus sciuri]
METIKIKGEIKQTCTFCPSIYEFKDEAGNDYYFRYRSSTLTLTKNDEIIFSYYDETDDFGGYMSWVECCLFYYSQEKVFVNDSNVSNEDHTMWLNSELMNELFKSIKEDNL